MNAIQKADLVVDFQRGLADADSRRARSLLAEHGCLVARNLICQDELVRIRASFRRIIQLRREHLGLPPWEEETAFDAGFLDLIERDPDSRRLIQMTVMFTLPLLQFGASARLGRLSEILMDTDAVIASDLQSLHIGLPGEEAHLLPWHQDYPWVQDSEDALIYWLPLRELPGENAALRVALGSHRGGVQRLKERDGRLMGLEDPTVADRFPQSTIPVSVGEVLVVHTLCLHRSVQNRSDLTRWTLQVRQGNFAEPKAVRRRWPGPRPDRTPFSQTHPEYCGGEAITTVG